MATVKIAPIEKLILSHLKDNGQKQAWLADKLGISKGHLHNVLKGDKKTKRELTQDNLDKINEFLGTEFKKA